MSRKERLLSVLKGAAMAAGGIFLLILENMWFQEQGTAGGARIHGFLVVIGLALLILGAAFLWDGCRRKKTSVPKERMLTACPYCGANVQGKERNCLICGKDMYEMRQ
ncbi:hypothetical protein [Anaerotignum sp.]|uniref:hypothetical protein n=1 Tax=Anaerotignum sp. TaxID=2039241 RepID=UPI002A9102D5|nr:hypothetical protein [Anaerotignum sp.]MCI7656825.1 hypothetical protein [Clostridia bacterium]MDY5414986.1 hypothetical protein [Anaerotignum sp.]